MQLRRAWDAVPDLHGNALVRLGLIARCDRGGLGNQTAELFRHMAPDRTLVVHTDHATRGKCDQSRYPGDNVTWLRAGPSPQDAVDFMRGLDVVFSCECLYQADWMLLAQQMGVAVVVQANPEMFDARELAGARVVLPTPWESHRVPHEQILPVPVALDRFTFRRRTQARVFYHPTAPAMLDRNGTSIVLASLQHVTAEVAVVIRGELTRGELARRRDRVVPDNVKLVELPWTEGPYWSAYPDEADVLLLPRRYGGLCLERGTPVETPTGRMPIEALVAGDTVLDEDGPTLVTGTAERQVPEVVTITARGRRLVSSVDHLHLIADQPDAPLRETKACDVEPRDWMLLVRPSPDGIRVVDVGPRPPRKGLRNWWPTVELDDGWARLVGLWLAEGFSGLYRRPGRDRPIAELKWTFGGGEEHLAREVVVLLAERGIRAAARPHFSPEATFGPSQTWVVRCRSLWLYEMFEALHLGHGSHGKRAPDLHADLVPALVGGWLDGDGSADTPTSLSGFSRSTGLIADMAHLLAKRGILASVTTGGQKLVVAERSGVAEVASWTRRLRIDHEYVRPPRPHKSFRPHERGWLVRVHSVEHRADPTNVVAIETTSGRYVANDLLTHNCLPMQESAALGMPTLTTDLEPQRGYPHAVFVDASPHHMEPMKLGQVMVHKADPRALAAQIDRLATGALDVGALSNAAREWAEALAWSAWEQQYRVTLGA